MLARLLIVEDEGIIAMDLCATLERLGYCVVGIAATHDEALREFEIQRPDLVMMDVRLRGEIDGIQTAHMLNARRRCPVIYMTANADPNTVQRALATAPGGYLAKPFHEQALHATIEVALSRHAEADRLRRDALHDPLTGLYNRGYFETALDCELAACDRHDRSAAVIMIDLDHFKQINDDLGHQVGDEVLRGVAGLLRAALRACDASFRWGGEELAMLLPSTGLDEARRVAERLRLAIERLYVPGLRRRVTASFGVAVYPQHGASGCALVRSADRALYAAKQGGRNRIEHP